MSKQEIDVIAALCGDSNKSTYEYPKACPACSYDGSHPPKRYTESYVPVDGDAEDLAYAKEHPERVAELIANWVEFNISEIPWLDFNWPVCQSCGVVPQEHEIKRLESEVARLKKIIASSGS